MAGKSAGEAVAFGLGFALGRVLDPAGTALEQQAWRDALAVDSGLGRVFDPQAAAAIVAEAVDLLGWGEGEAAQTGMTAERFDLLVKEVYDAPGLGELFPMWRRGTITDAEFLHGLRKAKLPIEWDDGLKDLKSERLSPQELAIMAQRGAVPNDGLLPVTFDGSGSNVTPMPVAQIDTLKEAEASGYDFERLAALARIVGLPPGPGELLQLVNRGEINDAAFRMGIAEGNTRNEWADVLLTLRRRLLTPHEYQEAALRGVLTNSEADAGSALSGLDAADAKTLFAIIGRPLATHQITTGLARGGTLGGTYADVPEPYRDAIRRSAIRPEYAKLDYANRYTYPSAFVIRALAQGNPPMPPAEVEQTLLAIGWSPQFAKQVTDLWTGGTSTANKHVTSAETGLFTVLRKAYVNDEATDTQAPPILTDLGVDEAGQTRILQLWGHERALVRSSLTAAQIKKAIGQTGKDQSWALTRLAELGYTPDDAGTFLAE